MNSFNGVLASSSAGNDFLVVKYERGEKKAGKM
jgi:hypothetical protein